RLLGAAAGEEERHGHERPLGHHRHTFGLMLSARAAAAASVSVLSMTWKTQVISSPLGAVSSWNTTSPLPFVIMAETWTVPVSLITKRPPPSPIRPSAR